MLLHFEGHPDQPAVRHGGRQDAPGLVHDRRNGIFGSRPGHVVLVAVDGHRTSPVVHHCRPQVLTEAGTSHHQPGRRVAVARRQVGGRPGGGRAGGGRNDHRPLPRRDPVPDRVLHVLAAGTELVVHRLESPHAGG